PELQAVLSAIDEETERKPGSGTMDGHVRKWFRIKVAIEVMAYGGLRAGELISLNKDDLTDKGINVRSEKKERDRKPALPAWVIMDVKEYMDFYRIRSDQKALFTTDQGRMSTSFLRKQVKDAGILGGVPRMHPHALRHFCGTFLLSKNLNIRKIQVQLGHKDVKTT
ncbi:site-specific recombinase, phage integrase family protein, partial [mine drainage metagenome]